MRLVLAIGLAALMMPADAAAQNAELSGFVRDVQGNVVADANLVLIEQTTGTTTAVKTNARGIYVFVAVKPGSYDLNVAASGFATTTNAGVILNVGQRGTLDVQLELAGRSEQVTVSANELVIGSADGAVSTVIDRKFAESLPVNGRTFGALLALAPGVAAAPTNLDGGQYSVNGQRSASNYLTVDGVAANSGLGSGIPRDSIAGQRPSSTITGGLNGLVSMDALQEIRIQTSSFSPEFGRSPGAQISVVTRSGTNTVHGSGFEQFRDQSMAANNWFLNSRGIEKTDLDQHQFGGTLGGPLIQNRTFYFGSYEGLRLLQPVAVLTGVPSLAARAQPRAVQQLFQSYPAPTGPDRADGSAEFTTSTSLHTKSDTWGARVDHALTNGIQLFARYSNAPSSSREERVLYERAVRLKSSSITTGATATLSANALVDVRATFGKDEFNDEYIAASPQFRQFFPSSVSPATTVLLQASNISPIQDGIQQTNSSTQANVIGSFSYLFRSHHFKTGIDFRRVVPLVRTIDERVSVTLLNVNAALDGVASAISIDRRFPVEGHVDSFSFYLQDTWKATGRLSLSYGLRWDLNPAPAFADGQGPLAVASSFSQISSLKFLPTRNVPLWKTSYNDIVPRAGFSYALDSQARLLLSGGAGLFGDLSGQAAGLVFSPSSVPNGTNVRRTNVGLPLTPPVVLGLDSPNLTPPFTGQVAVVDPNLRMPRTTQWNVSLERALGGHQAVSIAYVGAQARRLLKTAGFSNVSPEFPGNVFLTTATGRSTYQSMQVEYRRRASQGLQLLASYTLGKARDTASSSLGVASEDRLDPASFDVRHIFSTAASWDLPDLNRGPFAPVFRDWGLNVIATARSGYPFTVLGASVFLPGELVQGRASLVPGVPIIQEDESAPGGQRYNRAAFVAPPAGQHGDTTRNQFRGFAAYQVDMGLQRTLPLARGARLQVRIDAFNVLNNPSFGLPVAALSDSRFGTPTDTLNETGGFNNVNSLYRNGGPRVVELALRFNF